jgi:hypothetical protein
MEGGIPENPGEKTLEARERTNHKLNSHTSLNSLLPYNKGNVIKAERKYNALCSLYCSFKQDS